MKNSSINTRKLGWTILLIGFVVFSFGAIRYISNPRPESILNKEYATDQERMEAAIHSVFESSDSNDKRTSGSNYMKVGGLILLVGGVIIFVSKN